MKKEKSQKKKMKKGTKIAIAIISSILAVLIIVGAVIGALFGFGILGNKENTDDKNNDEDFIPSINTKIAPTSKTFTYYETPREHIVTDSGVAFVDNEIIVYLNSSDDKAEFEELLTGIGAKIVGELPEIAQYQILLDTALSREEMETYVEALREVDYISYADFNYAFKLTENKIPNDKEWKDDWEKDSFPSGKTWAMEAINAPKAWGYVNRMQNVNVGIMDCGFDTNHEDVKFEENPLGNDLYLNKIQEDKNKPDDDPSKVTWNSHGTHVAGTIGAGFNDKIGVTGVAPKAKLYGVSVFGLEKDAEFNTSQMVNASLYYLIADKKCSVINISMGEDISNFCVDRAKKGYANNPYAIETFESIAENQEVLLKSFIDRNYQFVICKSAGNQNAGGGYVYYKKDNYDPYNELAYYSSDDYEQYVYDKKTAEKNGTQLEDSDVNRYFAAHENDLDSVKDLGNVDTGYSNLFDGIEDREVKERIIVVGAVKDNGYHVDKSGFLNLKKTKVHDGFGISNYSNCGERVDILAPGGSGSGDNIENFVFSTVSNNGYDTMAGTSMATPHVTGAAAVLFSLKPDLDAGDVKNILCSTANGSYEDPNNPDNKYKLLNVGMAAEKVLGKNVKTDDSEKVDLNKPVSKKDALEYDGHYYLALDDSYSWHDAKKYCEDHGGYLACINSRGEEEFAEKLIGFGTSSYYWIGLTDMYTQVDENDEDDKSWRWVNGDEYNYNNFHYGDCQHDVNDLFCSIYSGKGIDKSATGDWVLMYEDGEAGKTGFICEWDTNPAINESSVQEKPLSKDRDIVLVLDGSGSMSGDPIVQMRKAAFQFSEEIMGDKANVGVVEYDSSVKDSLAPTNNRATLQRSIIEISADGGTNIESGLERAKEMLDSGTGAKKIIVLMSDGMPNTGKCGEELIEYARTLKEQGILIYTIGFFEDNYDVGSAQSLMDNIASEGCHYEASSTKELRFFFADIAEQIGGQQYVYVKIACPVDVTITYNGETLSSADGQLNTRTSFGTLNFEEAEENSSDSENGDLAKILRLKADNDYDIKINGTGVGKMDYTVGYMDSNGNYNDFRKFKNIEVNNNTVVDTSTKQSRKTVLNIDEDGDGKYDLKYSAKENESGKIVDYKGVYIAIGVILGLALFAGVVAGVCISLKKQGKNYKVVLIAVVSVVASCALIGGIIFATLINPNSDNAAKTFTKSIINGDAEKIADMSTGIASYYTGRVDFNGYSENNHYNKDSDKDSGNSEAKGKMYMRIGAQNTSNYLNDMLYSEFGEKYKVKFKIIDKRKYTEEELMSLKDSISKHEDYKDADTDIIKDVMEYNIELKAKYKKHERTYNINLILTKEKFSWCVYSWQLN